jgi:hypothetical protein
MSTDVPAPPMPILCTLIVPRCNNGSVIVEASGQAATIKVIRNGDGRGKET